MTTNRSAKNTKIGTVITLLRRKKGVTLEQLAEDTGWRKHTVRAALTGLRKKGHTIAREKRDGTSVYAIIEAKP